MKIGMLCPEFPPELSACYHGGITTYAVNMVNGYSDLGHEVHIFAPGREKGTASYYSKATVHRIPHQYYAGFSNIHRAIAFFLLDLHFFIQVKRESSRGRFDVIEIIDWNTPAWSVATFGSYGRLIVKLHGPSDFVRLLNHAGNGGPLARLTCTRERAIALRADVLVAAADVLSIEMPRIWRTHRKIPVLADPVGISQEASDSHTSIVTADPNSTTKTILAVGRLEERKGQATLVRALNLLQEPGWIWKVLFIGHDTLTGPGESSYKAFIEDLADPQVRQRMHFLGPIANEMLSNYYRSVNVVVVTTMDGNYGYTTLEAMAAGAAVISTRQPGGHDSGYLQDQVNGLLVPAGDPIALKEALSKVLGNPDMAKQLGNAARNHIRENYSPAAVASQLLAVEPNIKGTPIKSADYADERRF